jgi:ribonucleoside-triphosphate reductase
MGLTLVWERDMLLEQAMEATVDDIPYHDDLFTTEFLKQYKKKQPNWGFGNLGYVVYKRTYARVVDPETRQLLTPKEVDEYRKTNKLTDTEEWNETVERCIRGAQKIGAQYTQEEAERLFDHIFNLRCSFSGRGLWQLGTKTVDLIGMDSLLNCWLTKVSDIDDFAFIFVESMLGGGVGSVITKEFSQELPRVKRDVVCRLKDTADADFIIPDSKEGWKELWRKILEAYLVTGKGFTYSTVCIRHEGEPIKTFGGIAPGPRPLKEGAEELCRILETRYGKKLRTQDVADIICIGGQVVKSGGVRRTALILQGDVDDIAFINLKRWDLGGIPNYRANSNNSIMTKYFEHVPEKFWDGYNGNGEPCGLINLKNCRRYGRLGETELDGFNMYDESIIGVNPCAEATIADKECCNLAELFTNNIESKEQMYDCSMLLYKAQKAIAAGKYLHEETNRIVHKNMRLGLGVTGVCQRLDVIEEWCEYTYRKLRKFDQKYSKLNGWNISVRLTVIKPSGTLSLLAGAMPGGHPGYGLYHIRTVRFSHNDPLLPMLKKAGYKIEPEMRLDGSENHDISVVYFPCEFKHGGLISADCGAIKQLEIVKMLQRVWADQAVSVTVYYKKNELPEIKEWLKANYNDCIKTISFCLHSEHGFNQAPLQRLEKEDYYKMFNNLKPLDESIIDRGGEIDSVECAGGACPIK